MNCRVNKGAQGIALIDEQESAVVGNDTCAFFLTEKADTVTVNVTENVTLNKMEKLVYQLISINPGFTGDELADNTSKTVRTVQRTLNSLRDKGYIERIGSDKTGSWKILK